VSVKPPIISVKTLISFGANLLNNELSKPRTQGDGSIAFLKLANSTAVQAKYTIFRFLSQSNDTKICVHEWLQNEHFSIHISRKAFAYNMLRFGGDNKGGGVFLIDNFFDIVIFPHTNNTHKNMCRFL